MMAKRDVRPPNARADRNRRDLADRISTWRKLMGLTQDQLAQRAGVSRGAYARLEKGDPGVTLDVLMRVLTVTRLADDVIEALDPMRTDLGRARADQQLPQRVRR